MMRKQNIKQILRIMTLAWVYMTAFLLPYIQYNFYVPMLEELNITNTQLGNLIAMYSITCIVAYIPGGWIADRFSLKYIFIVAMFVNILLNIWLYFRFNYTTALIVWALAAFSSGAACWAALVKGVGLSGSSEEQGKIWGMYEFGDAFIGMIVSYINLGIFTWFENTLGIRSVFISIAIISCIAIILVYFFFEDIQTTEITETPPTKLIDIIKVLRLPVIWFVAFIIFSNYIVFAGMTYFTPYLSDVIGLSVLSSVNLTIIRSYGIRMIAGLVFGRILDKFGGRTTKVIGIGMFISAFLVGIFLLLPSTTPPMLLIGVFFIATFTVLGSRGMAYSSLEEAKIPNNIRGLSIAFVSMIAYSPDLFIFKFFGGLVDNYGTIGYTMIFGSLVFMCLITSIFCILANRTNQKVQAMDSQV